MTHHTLLCRQLRRLGIDAAEPPPGDEWRELLETVSRSYAQVDHDRGAIERSLAISSRELYDGLRQSAQTQLGQERDKLAKSLAIHEATLEASLDGVVIVNEHRQIASYNRRFAELWPIAEELLQASDDRPLFDRMSSLIADPEQFRARVRQLHDNPHQSSEDDLRLADGRVFAHHSAPIVVAQTGVPYGRVWFFRDVTAHEQDERRIRDTNAFLDSVIDNIPNTVFVKDALTLRYVRFNRAAEDLVGIRRDELIGLSDHDVFTPEQAESFVSQDREVLAQRGVVVIEDEQVETRHRGVRHLITKKIPIVDQDGVPRYLLGISEDITESLQRQQELRSAKEVAERASRAKSDFLANMSHELRTPLNSILGFARVLDRTSRENLDPKHREYFRYMTQGAQHMLQLVNDLLDLRTLEQDELAVGRVELAPVVHEAAALLQPLIDEKRIRFSLDLPADLAPAVAERRALIQVLINLLSNAVKFTPVEGAIAISVEVDGARVWIRVSDTGIGISATDQARLFTYFEQLGAKHAHNMKGSGIGLALTKMLVVKQGGSIHVDSSPGAGSTFTVALAVYA